MAAKLRRELGVAVEMQKGPYGHFEVLVGGETVVDGGNLAMLGVLPSAAEIIAIVRARLSSATDGS